MDPHALNLSPPARHAVRAALRDPTGSDGSAGQRERR